MRLLSFFKGANTYQLVVWGIIIVGTIVSILPPELFFFRIFSKFVLQIMLAYLVLGLLFLFLSDEKSMFVSFVCCGVLCLFIRTRPAFYAAAQPGTTISAMNCNLSIVDSDDFDSTISKIVKIDADVVSIQEVTPDWAFELKSNEQLNEKYPYDTMLIRMDFHGVALYSKYPFTRIDTFHYKEIPNLAASVKHDSLIKPIFFISSRTVPPVSLNAYENINNHLQTIADYVLKLDQPVVTLGDYQVMPWSSQIVRFRQKAQLEDSRRDMPATYFAYDHIFYSKDLNCTDFRSIDGRMTDHLGIIGTYQLKGPQ